MDASCLKRADAVFNVELHPCKLHNVEEGVSEHLNALLFRFQEDLNGFVIAYKDVNIRKTKQTFIHPYFPLVHLEVRAKVLLFKPAEGCMLVGKVIKIAADFVGLLVLGVFNASIAADSIRSEFKCVDGVRSYFLHVYSLL
ncbi:hypothetical protein CEUSTIGMA_g13454.t1 [Chlamydomonas eustigma]|uniref:Uncharacterized protein n=1 Tax=Chlamydomonas eustigma TaxID=1157962 RepID=A0A250XSV5_9CHLO|nr:hypothetical protein CEUSTIGMA_g13454.t1 [Chlamydomonas eustigma]|eukprot:GAX86039.1 hypothetical protein CEUSTIGMA_g13454.t1 [Chlamydomonas eustigma]